MGTKGRFILIAFILMVFLYFAAIVYLSKKRPVYLGIILPVISAGVAIYNYLKPILIHNPYPTMKEGIYMTFYGLLSIIGFIIFIVIRYNYTRNDRM